MTSNPEVKSTDANRLSLKIPVRNTVISSQREMGWQPLDGDFTFSSPRPDRVNRCYVEEVVVARVAKE